MKKDNRHLLFACLAGFAFSVNYTNHAPLAATLMQQFNFTKTMAGFLTTGIFATHALMQIPAGYLADNFGGKKILVWALTIVCIGNIGIAFSANYEQLLLWKIFVGFGTGASFVGGARYIAQAMPAERLYRAQGFYGASVLLGSGFVIFAVPRLANAFGWQVSFLSTAFIAVCAVFVWAFAVPSPEFKSHLPVKLQSLLSDRQLWLLGFLQMASFGLVILIGTWITELLKKQNGLLTTTAGAIGSLVLLVGIFTRVYGASLVIRLGYKATLALSMLLNVVGCFILASSLSSIYITLLAILCIGIGSGLPYSALFSRAVNLFPGRAGTAMGLVNMLGIIMILIGAPLIGKITDITGSFSAAFVALGIFALIAMLAAFGIKSTNTQLMNK
ncbi:MFS transporter [uncultured Mucilaginibacter sp.]|jgi:nitrate/nitrite transporter NarK|uniref:MFS transporter n=1 Tax=uncultured Mucilaginibacter sp. TaxID=797541 RepID=UPI0025E128B6|nr:MFS transporter [uncultured Mucilaginibacter sp.]